MMFVHFSNITKIIFFFSVLSTFLLFLSSIKISDLIEQSKLRNQVAGFIIAWIGLQGFIANHGFYSNTDSIPPHFIFAAPPAVLFIIILLSIKGKRITELFSLEMLTYLSVVRILVEVCLYRLFREGYVPELMTFAGRNFDIISGLTAPLVGYFCFTKRIWNLKIAMVWNIISLGLLINIVINAVLSVPTPFQQFAFDQPNVALLYFPFIWLPAFIVPAVLFSHIVSIMKLLKS